MFSFQLYMPIHVGFVMRMHTLCFSNIWPYCPKKVISCHLHTCFRAVPGKTFSKDLDGTVLIIKGGRQFNQQ